MEKDENKILDKQNSLQQGRQEKKPKIDRFELRLEEFINKLDALINLDILEGERIERLRQHMEERFDRMDKRFDRIENDTRFLVSRVDSLEKMVK